MSVFLPEAKDPERPEAVVRIGNEDELVVGIADGVHRSAGERFRHILRAEGEVEGALPLSARGIGRQRPNRGGREGRWGGHRADKAATVVDASGEVGAKAGEVVTKKRGGGCEGVGVGERRRRLHWDGRQGESRMSVRHISPSFCYACRCLVPVTLILAWLLGMSCDLGISQRICLLPPLSPSF